MCAIAAGEISGFSQCNNGTRKREVCSAESASVEPKNISDIQSRTGPHALSIAPNFKRSVYLADPV